MEVRIININKGHNKKLHEECRALAGYSELISKVNELVEKMPLDEAMGNAIRYCRDNGFITDFLRANAAEVENMLYAHFELDKALQAARDDAREDAWEGGRQEGRLEDARAMFKKGYSVEDIIDITKLSFEEIDRLKNN
jgi:predicted transposase/invertase (TIGR01784 family)